MTGSDLIHVGAMPSAQEIDTAVRIATNLAQSGMFKDAKQAEQAFAKIMLGRDLGLSPTQAMTSIYVVEGKPELSANLQAQLVKTYRGPDGERYDFKVLEHTADACEIEFRRRELGGEWEVLGTERFTMDDAAKAGLAGKNVWKSYPRNMLWARCLSNGVNFHCPEVARGLRVYHEGELDHDTAVPSAESQAQVEPAADPEPEPVDAEVVPEPEPITKQRAKEIVDGAWTIGIEGKLQLAASHAHGQDVGDCSTKSAATEALRKLTDEQAAKVEQWLLRKADEQAAAGEGVAA